MGGDWSTSTIGDTCYVTDGAHAKVARSDSGVLYLTSKNIGQGVLKLDKIDYISDEDYEKLFAKNSRSARRLVPGDVLTGIIGSFGTVYRYKNDDKFGISSAVAILRPNPEFLDSTYLSYVLRSKKFKALVNSYKSGSVQGYTNISTIKTLPLPLPPLHTQKAIGELLTILDDKIELNRQTNETLEAIAQAMFKSWFVDFDPVIDNALAAGNDIPEPFQARAAARQALGDARKPLPEEIRCEFPDEFVFSDEMGWVPRGWEPNQFSSIAEHIRSTIAASDIQHDEFYVGLEHIDRKSLMLQRSGSGRSVSSNKSVFESNDVLFGKLRPYFHKVCIAPNHGICSSDILVFRAKSPQFRCFMMLTLFSDALVENANRKSTGTRMPRARAQDILEFPILQCPTSLLEYFEFSLTSAFERGIISIQENNTLSSLRDTLLPKLLSGQLTIPNAEKLVAEAL